MRKSVSLLLFVSVAIVARGQRFVSITIDDIPNVRLYQQVEYQNKLLHTIDSLHLPVALFINEALIFQGDSLERSIALFNEWIKSPNTTLGNHGFTHAMYSAVGFEAFKTDILKGESISKELGKKQQKSEYYFRSPYNDLGKDSLEHQQLSSFLKSSGYVLTPFTTHSQDWLITDLYAYYKNKHMLADAGRIGKAFVEKTLVYFDYIDSLCRKSKNQSVKQIYLMHDNLLNADYFHQLAAALAKKGYQFITLDEALADPMYSQKDYYPGKDGFSWVYRWIKDPAQRQWLMGKAPDTQAFERELDSVKHAK